MMQWKAKLYPFALWLLIAALILMTGAYCFRTWQYRMAWECYGLASDSLMREYESKSKTATKVKSLRSELEQQGRYIHDLEARLKVYEQAYPEPASARSLREKAIRDGRNLPGEAKGGE